MVLKNATIQTMERLKKMAAESDSKQYAHIWMNWKDWMVYEAYRQEICTLKRGYAYYEDGTRFELTPQQKQQLVCEISSFMEFIYRTWTEKNADVWANGGTWHRNYEAQAARLLFYNHRNGISKMRLKKKPPTFEEDRKTFYEVFGIDL